MNPVELSIIIPVYNGAAFIEHNLMLLKKYLESTHFTSELIIVNDGSTDATNEKITTFARPHDSCRSISFDTNQGKGAALLAGLAVAQGKMLAFTDADLPYGVEIFSTMRSALEQHTATDFIYGSRANAASREREGYGTMRKIGRLFFSYISRWFVDPKVTDTQCGIKMFRRNLGELALRFSRVQRFAFDIELFAIAKANGLCYEDFPVELTHRKESSVHLIKDTVRMLIDIAKIKYRLWRGSYTLKDKQL